MLVFYIFLFIIAVYLVPVIIVIAIFSYIFFPTSEVTPPSKPPFKPGLPFTEEEKIFLTTYLKNIKRIKLTKAEKLIIDMLLAKEFSDCSPEKESLLVHSIAESAIDCKHTENLVIQWLSLLSGQGIKKINGRPLYTNKKLTKKEYADIQKNNIQDIANVLDVSYTELKSLENARYVSVEYIRDIVMSLNTPAAPKIKVNNTLKNKAELIDDLSQNIGLKESSLFNKIDKKVLLLLLNKVQLLDRKVYASSKPEKAEKELLLLLLERVKFNSDDTSKTASALPIINCEAMSHLPLNEIYTLFTGEVMETKGCRYIGKGFTKITSQRRKPLEIFKNGQSWAWKDFNSEETGNIMEFMRVAGLNSIETTQTLERRYGVKLFIDATSTIEDDEFTYEQLGITKVMFRPYVSGSNRKKIQEKENFKKVSLDEKTINKKIINEYLTKYLASKEWNTNLNIASIYLDEYKRKLVSGSVYSLKNIREKNELVLEHYLSLPVKTRDPDQDNEVLMVIENCEEYIELFDDLERLYKLFDKKGIKTNYLELIDTLSGIIVENNSKEMEKVEREKEKVEKEVEVACKSLFVKTSNKLGANPSKEEVIKEWLTTIHGFGIDNGKNPFIISVLLDKFNIKSKKQELSVLIDQMSEEVDLEEFEKNLGSPGNINIEELSKFSGFELERRIEVLFCQLGWKVLELHLSDNQYTDVIATENNETIAIRIVIGKKQVTENEIQKVVTLKKQYHADKAVIIADTDSMFTNEAIRCLNSSNIELWDGRKLRTMLGKPKPSIKDALLNYSTATYTYTPGQLGVLLPMKCPFCESDFQIEQEKLPEKDEEYEFNCPICGMKLMAKENAPL